MPVIKLHRVDGSFKQNRWSIDGFTPILFQTDSMTTAEPAKGDSIGYTKVTYREAMANSFSCRESVEEIEQLIKEANTK